MNILNIDIFKS